MFERTRAAIRAFFAASGENEAKFSGVGPIVAIGRTGVAAHSPWSSDKLATEGYAANVISFLCVRLVADAFASLPLLAFQGEREVPGHPVVKLLARPNPLRGQDRWLQELAVWHLIAGNSFIEAVRATRRGPPRELYALNPRRMAIIPGPAGLPAAYRFEAQGRRRDYPLDPVTGYGDVLHMREPNPLEKGEEYGFSPTQAAARWIDLDNSGADRRIQHSTGSDPDVAFLFQDVVDQNQLDIANAKLRQRWEDTRRQQMPFAMGGNASVVKLGQSLREMQWTEGMDAAARRICAAWNVPHILVVPGESTYANREMAYLELWEHTVLPFAKLMLGDIVPWFRWLYGDDALDIRIDEDSISALEPRRVSIRQGAGEAFDRGGISLNEYRLVLGYELAKPSDDPAEEPAALRNARQATMMAEAQQEALRSPQKQQQQRPGLDDSEDEDEEEERAETRAIKARVPDRMAASPLYAALQVDRASADALAAWATAQGVLNIVQPAEMHVTTVYSRTPVPLYESDDLSTEVVPPARMGLRLLGPEDKPSLVLTLESSLAQHRHAVARELGASWDYPEYIPHLTLSYDPQGVMPEALPTFAIRIGPEYVEVLDLDEGKATKPRVKKAKQPWQDQGRVPAGEEGAGRFQAGALSEAAFSRWLRTGRKGQPPGEIECKAEADDFVDDALDHAALAEEMVPIVRQILVDSGVRVFTGMAVEISFDVFDERVVSWLERYSADRVTGLIGETTRQELRGVLAQAMREGSRFDEIVTAIRGVMQGASRDRAEVIARTETTAAVGGGTQLGMEQAGVERKRWLATADGFTRDAHRELGGQTVEVDKPFSVPATSGMHPGAMSGGAAQNANCRCVTIPIPDEKADLASDTETKRDELWKAYAQEIEPHERALATAVRQGFGRQEMRLINAAYRRWGTVS